MLIPILVEDDAVGSRKRWVIYDTNRRVVDLGVQFPEMANANLYAVEDPSFKWAILSGEIGVA